MSSAQQVEPGGIICDQHIHGAGLPNRSEVILARERRSYAGMVESVFHAGKGAPDEPSELTTAVLHDAALSDEPTRRYAAAYVIGRCRARDDAADARLTLLLERLMAEPATGADAAIEAAMSLVLRGRHEQGRQHLRRAAASTDPFADAYKAAFFLAQLGDISGFPALARTLESDIPHYRLMALRHLIVFVPFDGHQVEGRLIDVQARLVDRLRDSDALVRQEVPFYLEELGPPGLRRTLESVRESDPDANVRIAAEIVLQRLR